MGFQDLDLKQFYDSDTDDILNSFYIPVLSEAILYKRLSGFFSSTSLAVAAPGILNLIKNNGKIQLICSPKFSYDDIKIIKNTFESIEKISEKNILTEIEAITDDFIKDHLKAFGWMLKNNILEIKIAIILDDDGYPLEERILNQKGMFHQKVGILEDSSGNKLSFSGSENESASGWILNVEEFKVFRNWDPSETPYFLADEKKFEKYWNSYSNKIKVIQLPDAIKMKLIEISPDTLEELHLEKWQFERKNENKIVLRDYQFEAINNWLKNKKGVLEMATGTGKTITALYCIKNILGIEKKLVIIISTPYIHLSDQWLRELNNLNKYNKLSIDFEKIIADSSKYKWKDNLVDELIDIKNNVINTLFIFTTHSTFSSIDFMDIIKSYKNDTKYFLIVDEVHGIGAPIRKKGLLEEYEYRLGLSATPKRWFDYIGTDRIFEYFGDVVFKFTLRDAISAGYLVPYYYKPYLTSLTSDELDTYIKETKKISKLYYSKENNDEKDQIYSLLLIKRQKIIRNAENKFDIVKNIIDELKEMKFSLIFCSPKQILRIQKILNEKNIIQHKFTQREGTIPETKFNGMSEREFLIRKFSEGYYHTLVAIKCLDEGVDIPQAKVAIMMDNSGNPREFIQRRGRILRKYPGKKFATIYDIIVEPGLEKLSTDQVNIEKKIISKELQRFSEFAESSLNSSECEKVLTQIKEKFGLTEVTY